MTLHLHRAPRTDQLADALGELLAVTARRPVRRGGRGGAGEGRRALAHPAAQPPARRRLPWRRRGVCRRAVPLSALPRVAAARPRPRRPVGARPARSGRCSPRSTTTSTSPGAPPWPRTSATARTTPTATCGATVATPSPGGWPRCSRRTPCSGRALVTDWREGRDTDGAGNSLDDDLLWQPELWRRLLDRVDADPPDVRQARVLERLVAGGDEPRRCPTGCRCSGTPGCRSPRSRCCARSASTATCTSGCPSPRPRSGTRSPTSTASSRAARTVPPSGSATRCWPRWVATPGSCAGCSPRSPTRHRPPTSTRPTPCWAGCSTTCAPTTRPAPRSGPGEQLREGDRSLQVHACHSAARQVDVLREVLVGLLDDDPTLEPRDITRMSRGSRVGSSSSSPTSTSRSTSTCRAALWQACTCRLRSPHEPPPGPLVGAGRVVGAQVVLQPAQQGVGRVDAGEQSRTGDRGEQPAQLAGVTTQ